MNNNNKEIKVDTFLAQPWKENLWTIIICLYFVQQQITPGKAEHTTSELRFSTTRNKVQTAFNLTSNAALYIYQFSNENSKYSYLGIKDLSSVLTALLKFFPGSLQGTEKKKEKEKLIPQNIFFRL